MSMPNVSDLVENSLERIDQTVGDDADFWGAAARLYEFEQQYSERPTYFRLMDLLERRGYFLTVPVSDHPDYEEHRETLERDEPTSVTPILRDPGSSWDEETNPVVAYRRDGDLYVERGGELWEALVDAGTLAGEEAQPPADTSLHEAVARVVDAAAEEGDEQLMSKWYAALGFYLAMEAGEDDAEFLERLRDDEALKRIRERVDRVDDLELTLGHPDVEVDLPPPPVRDAHPVLNWWYDLL